jgi:hypothetical protein
LSYQLSSPPVVEANYFIDNGTRETASKKPEEPSMSETSMIEIEDFYSHNMCRRYGGIRPRHKEIEAIFSRNLNEYKKWIDQFSAYTDQLRSISRSPAPIASAEPVWLNGYFPPLDAVSLYGLISILEPAIYLEVGSGASTSFAAKAKTLNSPETRIVSIDPCPRSEIDDLCDEVIRKPLEECDLSIYDQLTENDIAFFDGTHRVLQNSDTTVFIFDVLPRLQRGVYIHFHDIFWPFDYPDEWVKFMYTEQYAVGTLLMYGHEEFEIILPNSYIAYCTDLSEGLEKLWNASSLEEAQVSGVSLWLRKK